MATTQDTVQIQLDLINNASAQILQLQAQIAQLQTNVASFNTTNAASTTGLNNVAHASTGVRRELMVLGHEMATGNFSRFGGSLIVLAERATSLSQVMGELGTAARFILGPFGILAAAIAAIGVAFYQSAQESKEFNTALALTNNYVNLTNASMDNMAHTLSVKYGESVGVAKEALIALAKSGTVAGENLQTLSSIVIDMSHLTGEEIGKLSEKYAKLSKDPAKFAQEVNSSMHFLTPAYQEQIRLLAETGDKVGANKLLFQEWSLYLKGEATEAIRQNIGMWGSLSIAIGNAWDKLKEKITDSAPIEKKLKDINALIKIEEQQIAAGGSNVRMNQLLEQKAKLAETLGVENRKAEIDAARAAQSAAYQDASGRLVSQFSKTKNQLKVELEQFDKDIATVRKTNPADKMLDEGSIAKARQAIIDKYNTGGDEARAKQRYEASIAALDGFIKSLTDEYHRKAALIKADIDSGVISQEEGAGKIKAAYDEEIRAQIGYVNQKIALADKEIARTAGRDGVRQKAQYVSEVKHLNNELEINDAQYKAALARHAKEVTAIYQSMVDEISKARNQRATEVSRDINKLNMSALQAELANAENMIDDKYDAMRDKIRAEYRAKNALETQQYRDAIATLEAARQEDLGKEKDYQQQKLAAMSDWKAGATKAMQDIVDAQKNTSAQMSTLVSGINSTFEQMFNDIFTKGEISFKKIGASFAQLVTQMIAKAWAAKLTEALFSGGSSSTGQAGATLLSGIASMMGFRAEGGPVTAGQPYIVGERRPEVFVPNVSGTILPSVSAAAGMAPQAANNVTFHVTAMDSRSVLAAMDEIKRPLAEMMNGTNRSYNMKG